MAEAKVERRKAGRFALVGDLSMRTVPALWERTRSVLDEAPTWEVDLAEVARSDSAGLALLVEWLREAKRRGSELRLLHVPDQMLAIARVSSLDRILPLPEDGSAQPTKTEEAP